MTEDGRYATQVKIVKQECPDADEGEIGKAADLAETCNAQHLATSLVETQRLTYVGK
mgnify:CR=1 FL=1